MSEFLSKIENFLFDILGLLLPGLIALLVLILPTYFLDISKIPPKDVDASYILSGLTTISVILQKQLLTNKNVTITIVTIFAYLLGHVVKVFSIIKYDFLTVIFDKSINKLIIFLFEYVKCLLNMAIKKIFKKEMYQTSLYIYIKALFSPIKNTLNKIWLFSKIYG